MYCIYLGKEIDESEANVEHIIPLSLGGCNEFTIMVSKESNSYLGSKVDGKMAQDFLVGMDRVKHDDKGHSRKAPRVDVKSKLENGYSVITSFTKNDMLLFDPSKKQYMDVPHKIQMQMKLDLDIRMKFTAKVALATGYYLFGEKFVKHCDCHSLRSIMMSENLEETIKETADIKNVRFYDPIRTGKECREDKLFQVYNLFVQSNNASSVVWNFTKKSCIVFVSINGKFVGMVNFEAEIDKLPIATEEFWAGHTMICKNGQLIRMSWRDAMIEMCENTGLLDKACIEEAKRIRGY